MYVLTNPAMPGLVKIGMTNQSEPNTRVAQLYTTGVPVPFTVEFACRVLNPSEVEKALHVAFGPHRVNPKREFFQIDPEQAIAILKLFDTAEDVTTDLAGDLEGIEPQESAAAEKLKSRRPNLNFEEMGIPMGAFLHSNRSSDVVKVVGPKKVMFNGEEMSLSAATQTMMGVDYPLAPGPYWTFEGEAMKDIYNKTYVDL
ncbi:GIY-YIG nuclease family protein [Engelhardtia mirabilis]|uniref:GIY-YIG nuclease family protein n=1 Tax=Engelhardtia mirabilis TaxID=2528011 RepID=UPI003AF3F73F